MLLYEYLANTVDYWMTVNLKNIFYDQTCSHACLVLVLCVGKVSDGAELGVVLRGAARVRYMHAGKHMQYRSHHALRLGNGVCCFISPCP